MKKTEIQQYKNHVNVLRSVILFSDGAKEKLKRVTEWRAVKFE